MPRGTTTQTRTFNYATAGRHGNTVGGFLLSATNPENGTVTYTYNSGGNNLLASKTDAKGQQLTYAYDGYNRLSSVTWANAPGGAQVLRTYYYDNNPLDSTGTFSQNALGRLTAVQYPSLAPNTGSVAETPVQMNDMYSYSQPGLPADKRLQVNQVVYYDDINNHLQHQTITVNLDSTYTYNDEGQVTAMTYPSTASGGNTTPGASYNYSYDSMNRPGGMTSGSTKVVSGVSYNAANQLLGMTYNLLSESRSYNVLGQLTNINVQNGGYPYGTTENLTYNYPTGTNNGKVSSMYNAVSGETVTYTYDSLNRMATAAGSGWGEAYTLDPYGNLTTKTVTAGSGPSLSVSVNQSNNQVGGSYDANGNSLYSPSVTPLAYDVENRVSAIGWSNGAPVADYFYDGQNKRIWSWTVGTLDSNGNTTSYTVNAYSPSGQKLGAYLLVPTQPNFQPGGTTTPYIDVSLVSSDQYFGGRRLAVLDQLGSAGTYYPWGEAKGSTNPQDTWSYATYWRDSATGLDYTNNRYYSNAYGRFMTPDPGLGSSPANPQSWNRYTYTLGDPVNYNDPGGTTTCDASGGNCYDSVTVYSDGSSSWSDIPPGGLPVSGGAGLHLSMPSQYSIQTWQKYASLQLQLYETAQATGCPRGETRQGNGSCDLQLDSTALQVISLINQMNPGGFINAMGLAMGGAIAAGDMALAAADGAWLIEASNNTILLGRYADGYVNLGGIVGANTFSIPQATWETMTAAQQLAANQAFLDAAIANNSTIMFSSNPALASASSGLGWEYQYLVQQGFKVVQDVNGGWIAVH
jgi:RHS repeat-associated protein